MDWKEVTIDLAQVDVQKMLSPWTWLLPTRLRPHGLNLFGDWFLEEPDGDLRFLDAMAGQYEVICRAAEFRERLCDLEFRSEFLRLDLLYLVQQRGLVLKDGQTYAYQIPPALGGSLGSENVIVLDAFVWQTICGQLHEQIRSRRLRSRARVVRMRGGRGTSG